MPDHKPISEEELKEMEGRHAEVAAGDTDALESLVCDDVPKLIAEVRRLRVEREPEDEEGCDWPSCDAIAPHPRCQHPHRHFKDGRWLDDGSEM